jgi:hypothetical protein
MARSVVRSASMIARRALILVAPLLGVGACTAILGDFSTGPLMTSDDGGDAMNGQPEAAPDVTADVAVNDGQVAEGAMADVPADQGMVDQGQPDQGLADRGAPDAPSEGPTTAPPDAADADAGLPLYPLTCVTPAASTGARVQITSGFGINPDAIRIANVPNRMVRVVVVDYPPQDGGFFNPAVLRAYTLDPTSAATTTVTSMFPTGAGQVYDLERYGGATPGFVALFNTFDPTLMTNVLSVARLPDDSNVWIGPKSFGQLPNNLKNAQAVLTAIDGSQDDYYVVMSTISGSSQIVSAGRLNSANGKLPAVTTYTAMGGQDAFQLVNPGIANAAAQPYVLLQPNGQNGPPPLGAPAALLIPGAASPSVPIAPPANLNYLPYGLASATDPTMANVFVLVADLNQIQGNYRVGQVPVNSLPKLDPMSLAGTFVTAPDGGTAHIKDLLINNTNVHWENAMQADQLLALSPPVDLNMGYPGVNFAWWDSATGTLRTYAAGDGALVSDVANVHRADATFLSLSGSFGTLEMAYESASKATSMNNYPPPASDIWLSKINCSR